MENAVVRGATDCQQTAVILIENSVIIQIRKKLENQWPWPPYEKFLLCNNQQYCAIGKAISGCLWN